MRCGLAGVVFRGGAASAETVTRHTATRAETRDTAVRSFTVVETGGDRPGCEPGLAWQGSRVGCWFALGDFWVWIGNLGWVARGLGSPAPREWS